MLVNNLTNRPTYGNYGRQTLYS